MHIDIRLTSPPVDSFRVRQMRGMFDLPDAFDDTLRLQVELPEANGDWRVGAIVGRSGSGKSSVARAAFADGMYVPRPWPADQALVDCFGDLPIVEVVRTLGAVGLASAPSWLRPFAALSNGEQFRCELARALTERDVDDSPPVVFDEFTSVVDRPSAWIASAAVGRAVRRGQLQRRLVAVTCHRDILRWLAPDWVLDMDRRRLLRRRVRPAPLTMSVRRASRGNWSTFSPHHYLSADLHPSAQCFVASVFGQPAVFTAVLPFPHARRPGWREHRTVCLPRFQGVGLGGAMSAFVASLFAAGGKPFFSSSGHPAVIHHRVGSPLWRMTRPPRLAPKIGPGGAGKTGLGKTLAAARLTVGFEYIGPPRPLEATTLGVAATESACTESSKVCDHGASPIPEAADLPFVDVNARCRAAACPRPIAGRVRG